MSLRRGTRVGLLSLPLALLVLVGSGCRLVKEAENLPGEAINEVTPGKKPKQPDPAAVQAEVLRYADDFAHRADTALDEYARQVTSPEAQIKVLQWKLSLGSSALGIATGPNPTANVLDFVALATMMRVSLEERGSQVMPRSALDFCLERARVLETNAWKLAGRALTTDQQRELRGAIRRWHGENPEVSATFLSRPQDSLSAIREAGERLSQPGSVFSLVGLDPMSGLDPAVREITRTRLFAERALFAAERMPQLMRWQLDLLSDQVLSQEQITNAVASADRLSRAVESASLTAAGLPDRISAERKAILDALDTQEGRLRELAAQVTLTLGAGEKMSTSLNTTILSFNALMKRFGVGEPSTSPPDTNSPPFNILDYARTAGQVATMAQQLDSLIKDASGTVETPALDKRIAQLNALSGHARSDAKSVLNHAFLLVAGLIVLGFACAFVYRRVTPRGTTKAAAQ